MIVSDDEQIKMHPLVRLLKAFLFFFYWEIVIFSNHSHENFLVLLI